MSAHNSLMKSLSEGACRACCSGLARRPVQPSRSPQVDQRLLTRAWARMITLQPAESLACLVWPFRCRNRTCTACSFTLLLASCFSCKSWRREGRSEEQIQLLWRRYWAGSLGQRGLVTTTAFHRWFLCYGRQARKPEQEYAGPPGGPSGFGGSRVPDGAGRVSRRSRSSQPVSSISRAEMAFISALLILIMV